MKPGNYQEWITFLRRLQEEELMPDAMREAAQGTLLGDSSVIQRFQVELVETVNVVLKRNARRFLKNLNEALECNDIESIYFLFQRFKGQVETCLFFREITFLQRGFQRELEYQVKNQMEEFLEETVKQLTKMQEESQSIELEDMLYAIRKMKGFGNCRDDGKLQYDKTGS